jgi:alpha-tubulin suppressor-like RCC1 family protein
MKTVDNGLVLSWGFNQYGQFGNNQLNYSFSFSYNPNMVNYKFAYLSSGKINFMNKKFFFFNLIKGSYHTLAYNNNGFLFF